MKPNRKSSVVIFSAYEPIIEALEQRQLLSAALTLTTPIALSTPLVVFNAVQNSSSSPTQTITLTDTGDATLNLGSGAVTIVNDSASATMDSARFSLLNASSVPATLSPGQSFALQIKYSAISIGINSAYLDVTSNDAVNPLQQVQLRGIGTKGLGGTNQPSIATILQSYNIPTYVGDGPDDANAATDSTYPEPPDPTTQEAVLQRLVKAGTGPVTIQVLASFTASGFAKSYVLGTYTPGSPNSLNQLFYTTSTENQTTYVQPQGATTFDPGSNPFGFYFISNSQVAGRVGYSEDALNTWDTTDPRKFRFFPLENPNGSVVANAYVMTSTEWNAPVGYDFTNIVAIVRNVKAASGAPNGPVLGLTNTNAVAGSNTMVFSRIQNQNTSVGDTVHDTGVLDVNNTGNQPLIISSYTLSSGWTLVSPPTFPLTIAAGATTALTIKFVATSEPSVPYNETSSADYPTGGGTYHGSLVLNSNDPNHASTTVPLAGWWQYHSENSNEPSLQSIVNLLYGWTTNINSTPTPTLDESTSTTNSSPTYYGEEVVSGYWLEADPSLPVVVQQLASFHTQGNIANISWYKQGSTSYTKLWTTASDDGQTLFPYATGTTTPAAGSFTTTSVFGFDLDAEFSDDSKNPYRSGGGHDVRFYPVRDASGNLVPNTYIMTMDYASSTANFDFQDNVLLVSNIHPALVPAVPTDLFAANTGATAISMQWAPVQDTTLLGYNVYRAAAVTGPYTLLTSSPIAATSFIDSSAPTGTTSYYRVTSVDSTSDAESLGDIASAAVPAATVAGVGDPIVTNQSVNTQAGVAVVINELATATDASGTISPSTVVISTAAGHGTASINQSNGAITYTPSAGFSGTDTFQYTVADSTGAVSLPGTITVNVIAQAVGNPIVANLSETTASGTSITVNEVADATDSTGTLLPSSVAIMQTPGHGSASVDPTTGAITYNAASGFVGTDTIGYTISDNLLAVSPEGTITITVTAPPTTLTAATLTADTVNGTAVTIDDVAAATDPTGTVLPASVTITQRPANGTATVNSTTGAITYTPAAGFTGTDTLQYTLTDNLGAVSPAATITITVTAKSTTITAANLSGTTIGGNAITFDDIAAATDPTAQVLPSTVTITLEPSNGTATIDPNTGKITYTPDVTFSGTDTIQYTFADSLQAVAAPATITITVTARPTYPVAVPISVSSLGNGSATVNVIAAATAGTSPLIASSVAISTQPAHGTVSIDASTGSITYTPDSNFVGVDTLQYTVGDTTGAVSAPANLSFNVGVDINNTTAKSLTFTDANGNKIVLALTGGGSAEILFNGSGTSMVTKGAIVVNGNGLSVSSITATATTAASTLNITHRGSAAITIGDISVTGSLASLNAPFAELTGDLAVTGTLKRLIIGSATGATVSAQQIGSITSTGSFDAALTVSNAAALPFALGPVRIGGQIGAQAWDVSGNASSVLTGSVASGWTASFAKSLTALTIRAGGFAGILTAGAIGSISIVGDDTGTLTAGSIKSMRIAGRLDAASLHLTNAAIGGTQDLGHLVVTAATLNSQIVSAGNIGTITTAGISGSTIEAATATGVTLPISASDFTTAATIASFQVVGRGATFADTDIAAQTIGSLHLGAVQTTIDATAFGIGAGTVASFTSTLSSGGVLRLSKTQLASTASITAYLTEKSLITGDFAIRTGL